MMGPLHVSLNARELVFLKNSDLFNNIYKSIFGVRKDLGKKPRPWRIDLILHIVHMAWLDVVDTVYLKFGHLCKDIEFLYLTDLFSNLIPLVLDVYEVHHRGVIGQLTKKPAYVIGATFFFSLIRGITNVPL